jgi:hypothetical protein
MAHVMNRVWRLLVFFGVVAASLALAESKLGCGEPYCGQRGSIHWCADKAGDHVASRNARFAGRLNLIRVQR